MFSFILHRNNFLGSDTPELTTSLQDLGPGLRGRSIRVSTSGVVIQLQCELLIPSPAPEYCRPHKQETKVIWRFARS